MHRALFSNRGAVQTSRAPKSRRVSSRTHRAELNPVESIKEMFFDLRCLCVRIFFFFLFYLGKKKASAYRLLPFSPCLSERGHASPNLLLLISQEPHARSLAATRARLLCARKFYICRWICHVPLPSRFSLCRSWRRRYVLVIFKFPPQYGSARDNGNAS